MSLRLIRVVGASLTAFAYSALVGSLASALVNGLHLDSWDLTCLGVGVPAGAIGLLVAWHRPSNRIAWLFIAASALFGLSLASLVVVQTAGGEVRTAAYGLAIQLAGLVLLVWAFVILLFPDGRVNRHGVRWIALGAAVLSIGASLAQLLLAPPGFLPEQYGLQVAPALHGVLGSQATRPVVQLLDICLLLPPALALGILADRFRLASRVVRQQIKWFVYAAALNVLLQVGFGIATAMGSPPPAVVALAVAPLPTIGAGLGIFRYRLWEVDRLVIRTLAFVLLWLAAATGLVGAALAAGIAVGGTDRQVLLALGLALLVALAVQPLRARIEAWIERAIYGARGNPFSVVAEFAAGSGRESSADELAATVARTARSALGATWGAVWVKVTTERGSGLRLLAVDGHEELFAEHQRPVDTLGPMGPASPMTALIRDRVDADASAFAMLAHGEEVGVIAIGRVEGRDISGEEDRLLRAIAHHAALLLTGNRMAEELSERVAELRESRQRVIASQDAERRRLERDLHDGVQQRLVVLAGKLRQTAAGKGAASLGELADEAEDAVFALQDLARGIYPTVLTDQGLAAAFRAQAARTPLEVRVVVDPSLAGRRFPAEVEAALYFVGLEAMTNVQKHAGTVPLTLILRLDSDGGRLSLDIDDEGPGFDSSRPRAGTGLSGMRDRVLAQGGRLAINTRSGAGTSIRAEIPIAADIVPLQDRGTASRR